MIKWKEYNLPAIIWILGIHIGVLAVPFTFTWSAFFIFLSLVWITGGVGICLCYHRLLTHKSFQVPKLLEYFLTFLGVLASQGSPLHWVADHRLHHTFTDQELDPHSPRKGFLWSHVIWLLKRSKVLDTRDQYSRCAPDIGGDSFYKFLDRTHWIYPILLGIGLYMWGGVPFLVWGLFFRTAFVYHTTWFVNSAAHKWGYKSYALDDDSKNLWWVALLNWGEGWHNNHHSFRYSARHGLRFWEIDLTYASIKFLSYLGLAEAIKLPKRRSRRISKKLRSKFRSKNFDPIAFINSSQEEI